MEKLFKKLLLSFFLLLASCDGGSGSGSNKTFNSAWTPQFSNIVQYWAMGNSSLSNGSVFFADLGFNGTVANTNNSGMVATAGQVGFAVQFDGIDDHVVLPYYVNNNLNHFSVVMWVKITGGSGDRGLLTSRDDSPAKGYALYLNSSNEAEAMLGQGTGAGAWATVTGTPILSNVWTHIAFTYDGTSLKLYKNGSLEGTSVASYVTNTTKPLYIGAGRTESSPSAGDFFTGVLDEVAIWQSVLSDSDVQTIYNNQAF